MVIKQGTQIGSTANLDVLEFLLVAHLYYYFSEFEIPFKNGMIIKKDVIRAIDEYVLPTTLSAADVNAIYAEQFDNVGFDFKAFGGALYSYRLFMRFSSDTPGALSKEEWNSALEIPNFNQKLISLIDKLPMPT